VVAGWVAVVRVAELVRQGAEGVYIVEAVLQGNFVACGHPCGFRAATVPPDTVASGLSGLNKSKRVI
jgi:hypothetical protein